MTVKRALKEKNKLIKEINELYTKIKTYNSVSDDSEKPYSTKELLSNIDSKLNELVELKTKIHLANGPVYDKIFRMAELKSHVSKLNQLDCSSGKQKSWGDTEYTNKVSEIKIVDRDYLIKVSEEEIEKLQDELDEFNATTNI
jgi:hypothetical protein